MEKTDLVSWLNGRPEETRPRDAALIAMRAAARVFPFADHGEPHRVRGHVTWLNEIRAIQIARCLLTVGVLTVFPKVAVTIAARLAVRSPITIVAIGEENIRLAVVAMKSAQSAAYTATLDFSSKYVDHAWESITEAAFGHQEAWDQVKNDTRWLELGKDISKCALWSGQTPDWFLVADEKRRIVWESDPDDPWDFWTRWWDGLVTGKPLDWALQEKVALIPDAIWQQGAAAVARAIREIEEQDGYHVSKATRAKAGKLLRAAIGSFTFDQVRGLITLGPFAEDLAFIKQPEVIDLFLAAAADVRERIDALQTSFSREGRGMQGAGALQVYLGKVDEEFSKARQVQVLRVGTLLNWINILRTIAADDSTRQEISPLHVPLDDLLNGLDDLIRTYFAQALVRVAPLKDIRSDENVPLADLLQDVRRGMDVIRASEGKELVPLAPEVIAIFDDTLADLDLLVRAELSEPLPARRSALRREFDFQWAQIVVSWLLYREASIKNKGWAVDALASWGAMAGHVINLRELIKWVIGFFTAP